MKKKVLFLITKGTWGGAQRYVFDLATHVPRNEFEAFLACGTSGKLTEDLLQETIRSARIPSLSRDVALVSDIASFLSIRRFLARMRPDVLHLNSSKAAALGALAGRMIGVPKIVFTVHGWPFKESRNVFSSLLIYLISWFTAALSDAVITVSETDTAIARRMWGVARKVHYVPLGLGPISFMPREAAQTALSVDPTFPSFVSNGELTYNKGIRFSIESIAMMKRRGARARYYIIGEGEERAFLERRAKELGVSEDVRFLGFVPNAAAYLLAFDLYVLPSIKEGMPYVLLEAAAAGLPIVCTNVVDPSFVRTYEHVRAVAPKDTASLADAMLAEMNALEEKPLFPEPKSSLQEMVDATVDLYRAT